MAKAKKEESAKEVLTEVATAIEEVFPELEATVVTLEEESAEISAKEPELVLADELAALGELAPRIAPAFDALKTKVAALNCEALAANAERIAEYGTNAVSVQNFKFSVAVVLQTVEEATKAVDKIPDAIAGVN